MSSWTLKVIALTANAMKGDADECLAAGMDAHVAKPINTRLLEQALSRVEPRRE